MAGGGGRLRDSRPGDLVYFSVGDTAAAVGKKDRTLSRLVDNLEHGVGRGGGESADSFDYYLGWARSDGSLSAEAGQGLVDSTSQVAFHEYESGVGPALVGPAQRLCLFSLLCGQLVGDCGGDAAIPRGFDAVTDPPNLGLGEAELQRGDSPPGALGILGTVGGVSVCQLVPAQQAR